MLKPLSLVALVVAGCSGPAGKDGAALTAEDIMHSIFCAGGLDGTRGMGFNYSAHLFANGDIFASANIYDPGISAAGTALFSPQQNGAIDAPVAFVLDENPPANGGWWRLTLNRATLVVSIVYSDVDAPGGQSSWTMAPSLCVANDY